MTAMNAFGVSGCTRKMVQVLVEIREAAGVLKKNAEKMSDEERESCILS